MNLVEYIFYRVAKFYYKRDGSSAFRAVAVLSVMQGMLIVDLFLLIRVLFLHQSDVQDYVKYSRIIGIALAILLIALNYLHFKDKYWVNVKSWGVSEKKICLGKRNYRNDRYQIIRSTVPHRADGLLCDERFSNLVPDREQDRVLVD